MNPAIGITKILNNLEECIEIINKINERNQIIIPRLDYIEKVKEIKKNLIGILKDGSMDELEKIALLAKETENISDGTDNLISYLEHFIPYHKKIISELDSSLDNSIGRIKNIQGEHRVSWFKGWPRSGGQEETFKGVITGYCNWEYPVMEIFPGNGELLQYSLSGEPLYIVDWDEVLLDNVSQQFNSYYASKRLMKYTIKDYDLSSLPQNSFGFIYCLNWLMFEKLEGLVDLAKNVYNCLMPGGTYLFYYNNSDDWWSVTDFNYYYFGLVSSADLKTELTKIGFEIIDDVRSRELNASYFVCKKPGEIDYIKNSSILGKVIDKSEDLK